MLLIVLIIIIALAWWALHLMEQAYRLQQFSRMLAGLLVGLAAGGVMMTYFFMSDYIDFVMHHQASIQLTSEASEILALGLPFSS
ncbi:MAG: hypothetical protein OHK0012_09530 [Synechococcales cyanobacterium]